MSGKTLPSEHNLILLSARLDINSSIREEIKRLLNKPIDWHKTIKLSKQQQISPFLYYTVKNLELQNAIPQDILTTMKKHYYSNLKRNLRIEKEIFLILELAKREGISIIPFRGFSLIYTLYRNPGIRVMADVDILIKGNEFYKINSALTRLGYYKDLIEKIQEEHYREDQHLTFSKTLAPNQALLIDIHSAIAGARPYKLDLPLLWQRTREKDTNNRKLPCLSQEDTFLSFALHLRKHTRRLTLKFIVDIAEFLKRTGADLDWAYITKSAKNNRAITTVYFSLYIAMELFRISISSKILGEFRPNIIKRRLLYLLINEYNFFSLKKWQGILLRLLLFDSAIDFLIYLWRVSLLKRFIAKKRLKKTTQNAAKNTAIDMSERIKK